MIRAIDLFAGAGGSSAGAAAAGATLLAAVDTWLIAAETYADNFPNVLHLQQRCEDVCPETLRKEIGAIDLLIASPECTSHTCAKGNAPRSESSRRTAFEVIRFAEFFKPRWVVIENVVHMRSWKRYSKWLQRLKDLGYHVREQVFNAADFGVPQARRRLFILCDRERMPPEVKPPTLRRKPAGSILHRGKRYEFTQLRKRGRAEATLARARRAIAELGKASEFLIVYYGSDAAGGWQRVTAPLRTITTIDRFAYVRPARNGHEMRMLQVDELKRAMGFAATFQFRRGTRRNQIHMIGNAVCPPVMELAVRMLTKE